MKIVLAGQAAFGEKTLERLAQAHEIVAVYCPPDSQGGKPDPLKARSLSLGIPVFQPRSMKGEDVHREFAGHRADLLVLAYVTVIVPDSIVQLPPLGTICFHPSLLPRYRGGSAINWQIIRGETRGGLTVFWTDAGIDTGPILLQKELDIGPDDTAGSLYFDKIFALGVNAMEESVRLIAEGRAPRIVQDESRASYDPLCRDPQAQIRWVDPVADVYNLIRGTDPQPGAWALLDGEKVRLFDCRRAECRSGAPGEVVEASGDGVLVAAVGGAIRVGRFRFGDVPKKWAAVEAVTAGRIATGARLL